MSNKVKLYINSHFNAMIELGDNMAKKKKKKLKLKKKNFAIFLLCITLIIGSISYGIYILSSPHAKKTKEMNNTKEEIKLQQLNHIEKKIDYFNNDYLDRYIDYKNKNKDLSIKDIIIEVNIGLDNDYYTNTKETPYLNKSYILVNKYNYLPEDYVPKNLEPISEEYARSGMQLVNYAKEAFESLATDAKKDGMTIVAMSSYRSYQYQENLYNRYVQEDGKEAADTYSGRPGFSEHQSGLAVDVYNGEKDYTDFEETEEFEWMQENAYKYGFILRFPKEKTKQTGYQYESWHYRYVGKEIATYIHEKKISYEEYYVTKIENQQYEKTTNKT